MTNTLTKAYLSLFFVSVLWGSNYTVSAYLLHGFSPIFLSTIRISFTSLFLIIIAIIQKGMLFPTKSERKYLLGAGVFGTLLNQTFYFTGLHHTTPANASLIFSMAPIATILLERLIFKVKLTLKKAVGAVISLLGVLSIIGGAGGSFGISWGDFNVLVAMLSMAVSLLFIRGLSKTMHSYLITIYSTVLGSALMIPAAGVESLVSGTIISHSVLMWTLLISAGIMAQGIAGFWWNKGVATVGAGTASMFMNIQPFVAIIVSHFVLGNRIMLSQIVGGIFVLLGVFIANMPQNKAIFALQAKKSAS